MKTLLELTKREMRKYYNDNSRVSWIKKAKGNVYIARQLSYTLQSESLGRVRQCGRVQSSWHERQVVKLDHSFPILRGMREPLPHSECPQGSVTLESFAFPIPIRPMN